MHETLIPDPAFAVPHPVYEAVAQRYVVQVIRHYVGASYKWAKSSCKSPRQSLLGLQSWALLVTSSSSSTSQCASHVSIPLYHPLTLLNEHRNNILVCVKTAIDLVFPTNIPIRTQWWCLIVLFRVFIPTPCIMPLDIPRYPIHETSIPQAEFIFYSYTGSINIDNSYGWYWRPYE